jgi:IclR helix-turn-helix domain
MSELLERIRGEIHERLAASRAAAEEYRRLEAALAALGGPASHTDRRAPARALQAAERSARRAARGSRTPRAPRGANREAVLRVLGERPGVGASELAAAAGVKKPVVYALLSRLVDGGEVVKQSLPSGSTGYALARQDTGGSTPVLAIPSAVNETAGEDGAARQPSGAGDDSAADASGAALAA